MEDLTAREGETAFRFSLTSYTPEQPKVLSDLLESVRILIKRLDTRFFERKVKTPPFYLSYTFTGSCATDAVEVLNNVKTELKFLCDKTVFIDHAFITGALAELGPRLIISDVDSTFISQEVIELIARHAGTESEVQAITEAAMRGELDFTDSLKERVATLSGLDSSALENIIDDVTFTPGATELVNLAHKHGAKFGLVSGGFMEVLTPLVKNLSIDRYTANRLEIADDYLTGRTLGKIIDSEAKLTAVKEWSKEFNIPRELVVCIGDGANDLKMLAYAGHSFAFCAKPVVVENADSSITFPRLDILATMFGWEDDDGEETRQPTRMPDSIR
ncbi:phosphoserine phosphatase SerB [Arcanobacterium ihumii]|uniref:phosphoserine phosphatase SerB n=1 Tax=Arcanobacterium ihumii TaxID=2138162 RepID=UPI000F5349CB|nr:phosphoserine phosphatase SerB [Arcanobacterium ihumii]